MIKVGFVYKEIIITIAASMIKWYEKRKQSIIQLSVNFKEYKSQ